MKTLFEVPATPVVPVAGEEASFPVHRIFCVGRNYAAHASEMGFEVDREAPFYFTKPASAIVASGSTIAYPPGTQNLHHEMELVIAIGAPAFRVGVDEAMKAVFGYAAGLDMTRRDLQLRAREKGRPWDFGKAFEQSAVIAAITPAAQFGEPGPQRIWLNVGNDTRQDAQLSDLIWSVPEIVSHLSGYYHLVPGDLIYTGTPAGVGAVEPGDVITGGIDGLADIALTIGQPEQKDRLLPVPPQVRGITCQRAQELHDIVLDANRFEVPQRLPGPSRRRFEPRRQPFERVPVFARQGQPCRLAEELQQLMHLSHLAEGIHHRVEQASVVLPGPAVEKLLRHALACAEARIGGAPLEAVGFEIGVNRTPALRLQFGAGHAGRLVDGELVGAVEGERNAAQCRALRTLCFQRWSVEC